MVANLTVRHESLSGGAGQEIEVRVIGSVAKVEFGCDRFDLQQHDYQSVTTYPNPDHNELRCFKGNH